MEINSFNLKEYKDIFNYYNLITKINAGYKLFFDEKEKLFLIVNINRNFEICHKFNTFSSDVLLNLQKNNQINSFKIFKEIEDFNENLENKIDRNLKQKLGDELKELYSYSKQTNNISNDDINKIIEDKND